MTIFQLKNGNVEPIAIIKAGKTTKVGREAPAAAAAPMAAPAAAPAAGTGAGARSPDAKDAPKK